ncbi:MAG TPA: hypothetical protein VL172_14045 [Kofleriaceae bacterium]|nr:hypothetical protein [Kofleriaceae bacterium]
MAKLALFPPDAEAQQMMGGIRGLRMTPGEVFAVDGPTGVGPEAAGAIIVLHATFIDDAGMQTFYKRNAEILRALTDAPGFIRFMGLFDGFSAYGIGFWLTPEDALAFARRGEHGAAVKDLRRKPYQYSQFAGVWSAHSVRARTFYCDRCQATTPAPADKCGSCDNPLTDVFREV